jgi:hypothetical protein
MKKIFILIFPLLAFSISSAQSLPTGLQTFQSATGSGTPTVTSVGGFFILIANSNGSPVNVYADQYGAYVTNSATNIVTTYFEVKAAGSLGSFEISTATIGSYNYSTGVDHFTNIYLVGYLNNIIVAQTTPVNSVPGTWPANYPINYSPFTGKRVDLFRVYYTKQTDAFEENFNFQDFTVANSSVISVATNPASLITTAGATLNGTVDPNGTSTAVTFEYGTTTSYGTTVTADQSPLSGSVSVAVSKAITGLSPGILYHFRTKGLSNSITTNGTDQTFTTLYVTPSIQMTSILLPSNTDGTQLNVSGTNGNGTNRVVFMKLGTGVITNPSNNTTYTANANWSSKGTQLGSSGYYCIYNGTGNTVSVTNTTANTEYTIQAFEYNGISGSEQYYTATSTGNPSTQTALPVELTSFTVNAEKSVVTLTWQTATEVKSYGFDIERKTESEDWRKIGFVKGNGNSNSSKEYSYSDNHLNCDNYKYRLKMVDNNGTFEYSKVIETAIALPKNFELSQNYPNPFNPSTKIDYQVPVDAKVVMEVYNIAGQKVVELVNQQMSAGYYTVDFGTSKLSSGVYIYRFSANDKVTGNNFSSIKKMMLLK